MVDPVTAARLSHRLLFLALAALLIFLRLLPLSSMPVRWPGPDLLTCLTFAWLIRRPDYVPALVVVAVFLVDDLLTMRPPGLWPLLVLMATEFLRSREVFLRDLPFALEWAVFAAMVMVMTVVDRLVLTLFMVPQTGFDLIILQVLSTLAAYPLVVLANIWLFGLRRLPSGQPDTARGRA